MAATKIYAAPETPITFRDSGGSANITLANLAHGASRISARYDRGAGSRARRFHWRVVFQTGTIPTTGGVVLMFVPSDGVTTDGNYGTTDSAVTGDIRVPRFEWIYVTTPVAANTSYSGSGLCTLIDRYVSVMIQNVTGVALRNLANASYVVLTPMPPEIQA